MFYGGVLTKAIFTGSLFEPHGERSGGGTWGHSIKQPTQSSQGQHESDKWT